METQHLRQDENKLLEDIAEHSWELKNIMYRSFDQDDYNHHYFGEITSSLKGSKSMKAHYSSLDFMKESFQTLIVDITDQIQELKKIEENMI
jgi:prophage DNA circulation protein